MIGNLVLFSYKSNKIGRDVCQMSASADGFYICENGYYKIIARGDDLNLKIFTDKCSYDFISNELMESSNTITNNISCKGYKQKYKNFHNKIIHNILYDGDKSVGNVLIENT